LTSRRSLVVETALGTALLVLGFAVGLFASRHYTESAVFYQEEFGPAVMIASGHGFVETVPQPGSALADFLAVRRPSLSTSDVTNVVVRPPDQFQEGTRYLLLAVGYVWRILGISWVNVSVVGAVLFGLSIVACYAICRIWLARPFAVAGALFICFSPLQLRAVPHIRDYSKAPFILIAIALAAWVAVRPVSRRTLLLLSAACGAVIGLGLGFRMDVVVMAPIFLISLVAFRGRRPWTGIGEKALAVGAFVVAIASTGGLVLSHLSSGGTNGFRVILLGYAGQFDNSLDVNTSSYQFLPFYRDEYVDTVVKSYGARVTGQSPVVPSPEYDELSRSYWLTIIRNFPADALTRALAAANIVLNIPFSEPKLDYLSAPAGRGNPLWNVLTNRSGEGPRIGAVFEYMARLKGWGAILGVVLIAIAGVESAKLGLFSALILATLTGYTSLQFSPRHFFHLEIIPVLGLLVPLQLIARRRWPTRSEAMRLAGVVVAIVATVTVPVAVLRAYQRTHLRGLFQQYIDAPRESLTPAFDDMGDRVWRVRWDGMSGLPRTGSTLSTDYFVVEFEGEPGPGLAAVGLRYKPTPIIGDFSRVVSMPRTAGVNRIFIPAYGEPPGWAFDGLELPDGIRNRLRGIYRVTHLDRIPLLLDLRLSGTWRQDALNQTLRAEGAGFPDSVQVLRTNEMKVPPIAMIGMVESSDARPNPTDVGVSYTKAVRIVGDRIEVDGPAETWASYLLTLKPVSVAAPARLLVKGHLDTGGLVLGLLKDKHWYRQLGTDVPGDFVGIIDITESGTYTPIITNATRNDHDRNKFVLSRFGLVAVTPSEP
jgi:hypothetical protein